MSDELKQKLVDYIINGSVGGKQKTINEVNIAKVIALTLNGDDLRVKEEKTSGVTFENSTFDFSFRLEKLSSSNISFFNCTFKEKLIINDSNIADNIVFKDCNFRKGLELTELSINSLHLIGNNFNRTNLLLKSLLLQNKLLFTANSSLGCLTVDSIKGEGQLLELTPGSSSNYRDVSCIQSDRVEFFNCRFDNFQLSHLVKVNEALLIKDCVFKNIELIGLSQSGSTRFDISISKTLCDNGRVECSTVQDLLVACSKFQTYN